MPTLAGSIVVLGLSAITASPSSPTWGAVNQRTLNISGSAAKAVCMVTTPDTIDIGAININDIKASFQAGNYVNIDWIDWPVDVVSSPLAEFDVTYSGPGCTPPIKAFIELTVGGQSINNLAHMVPNTNGSARGFGLVLIDSGATTTSRTSRSPCIPPSRAT